MYFELSINWCSTFSKPIVKFLKNMFGVQKSDSNIHNLKIAISKRKRKEKKS